MHGQFKVLFVLKMWPLMFAKVQQALLEKKKRDNKELFHVQADFIDEEISSDSGEKQ